MYPAWFHKEYTNELCVSCVVCVCACVNESNKHFFRNTKFRFMQPSCQETDDVKYQNGCTLWHPTFKKLYCTFEFVHVSYLDFASHFAAPKFGCHVSFVSNSFGERLAL
jgi:hypothetical protein